MRANTALSFFLAPLLFSCSDATGSLVGGDSLTMVTPSDASTPTGDGGGGVQTNQTNTDCIPGGNGAHAGNTWTDLYACYFGTSGTDSCAGTAGGCHGASGDFGGGVWVCGMDAATCYAGMKGNVLLSPQTGASDPTMDGLYTVLCSANADINGGAGQMPLGCGDGTRLGSTDFARIAAWIAAGAPQN